LQVKPETALVRPFVVAAVLRGVSFDATRYKSFIDLQVLAGMGLFKACTPDTYQYINGMLPRARTPL
jgi:hypothetical protein